MQTNFDAIIIGAGPAGSTAAILLARAGWSVALVEKQCFPRRKVCGECIAASNFPLLEALGIGERFLAIAGPELRKLALVQGNYITVAELPEYLIKKYAWGRALGRETLDTLLLEAARRVGACILQPWSVQSVSGEIGNWHCEVKALDRVKTSTLSAPVLIDAHGSWEALPADRPYRQLIRRPSDLFAFKANFSNVLLEEGLLSVLSFKGGYGGMVVADNGLTTVAGCIRRDRLEEERQVLPKIRAGFVVEALLKRECKGVRDALQIASIEGSWLAAGPLNLGNRLHSTDTVFRIGNAAGEIHPIIGEGMSMALQSAWLLVSQLLKANGGTKVLSANWQRNVQSHYVRQWQQHFKPRLRVATAFAHLAMHPAYSKPCMLMAHMWPEILTQGAKWAGKVNNPVHSATIALLTSAILTGLPSKI